MPRFDFEGHMYNNPAELSLAKLGGKWKVPILHRLMERSWRYNELKRELTGITHKMLTEQLRELESDGLVTRTVHQVVPPRVDYAITPLGGSAACVIKGLREFGLGFYRDKMGRELY